MSGALVRCSGKARRQGLRPCLPLPLLATVIVWSAGCREGEYPVARLPPARSQDVDVAALAPQVEAFCGDCHATPHPDTFPREAWHREVKRGFHFYFESFRNDLTVPAEADVIAYYQALAPESLVVEPPPPSQQADPPLQFQQVSPPAPDLEPPAVSHVSWLTLPGEQERSLVFCDMRSGEIGQWAITTAGLTMNLLSTMRHPARLSPCDLDGDGQQELVVAELGSFTSADHPRGALVWLRPPAADSGHAAEDRGVPGWRQRLLVSGLGRVADVQPGDFDGDGDQDLIVAEFGHLRTGRILLYENQGVSQGIPRFHERVIDPRHGGIQVPTADLNGDGRLDFVALISQEHEVVEAYLNQGQGEFRAERIFTAGDPAYGSSGIQLVDLDQDGDLDVLYSNGDTFGSDVLKPYHGVIWLENRGEYPYTVRPLCQMVGVQRALAADLDGDSDLDVVAVGFMPSNLIARPEVAYHHSVIWLRQTGSGEFRRYPLETASFQHAALEVGDFDADGDTDLAIGNFQDLEGAHQPALSLWWNAKRDRARHGESADD